MYKLSSQYNEINRDIEKNPNVPERNRHAITDEENELKNTEKALLNILDDYLEEKDNSANGQRALLNILEDYTKEKHQLDDTQRAVLNILEDYSLEKSKVETINDELVYANKELEQFVYVASHDLQEPLRTITNFAGLFEKKYEGKLDKDADMYLRFITNAASKMQNLIRDLLKLTRVGRDLAFTKLDCNKVLEEVLENLSTSILESNAKIRLSVLPVVNGIEIELKQLFQNLISNAIKFRKKDTDPEIRITAEQKGDLYLFSVEDNGIGIEEEYKDRIFVIFQRLHTVNEYQGTGIGLATCKKIVGIHNGEIWMNSKLGEGSTFYFTIPKDKRPSKPET